MQKFLEDRKIDISKLGKEDEKSQSELIKKQRQLATDKAVSTGLHEASTSLIDSECN